jgi:hypothetical protein
MGRKNKRYKEPGYFEPIFRITRDRRFDISADWEVRVLSFEIIEENEPPRGETIIVYFCRDCITPGKPVFVDVQLVGDVNPKEFYTRYTEECPECKKKVPNSLKKSAALVMNLDRLKNG